MSYEKTTWQTGDIVTAEKLNNIENGIENAGSLPSVTAEDDGDVLTVVDGAWAKATPSGGGGPLVIGVTSVDDVYTLNKTWKEIYDAMASGQIAMIVGEFETALEQYIVKFAEIDEQYAKPYTVVLSDGDGTYYAETQNDYPSIDDGSGDDGGGGGDVPS